MEQSNRSSHNDAQIQRLARDKEDGSKTPINGMRNRKVDRTLTL